MATAPRKARKRAGIPFTRAQKIGTPVLERSHTWRQRVDVERQKVEFRPSSIALVRYGVRDLGWQEADKYLDRKGQLRKAARA